MAVKDGRAGQHKLRTVVTSPTGRSKVPESVHAIRQEHRFIVAVLHCFEQVLQEMGDHNVEVDPAFFRAVIEYIREFPDRFHHPKEDRYLFKALARRRPDLKGVLDELSEQHREGERRTADLMWKAKAFESSGMTEFDAFSAAAFDYIRFQRNHLSLEEGKIIPAAVECLTDGDWAEIDAAFADNDDPVFGSEPKQRFQSLISEIVRRAPEPHGLARRTEPDERRSHRSLLRNRL